MDASPERIAANAERRKRVSEAGGKLLSAVFEFLGELAPAAAPQEATPDATPAPGLLNASSQDGTQDAPNVAPQDGPEGSTQEKPVGEVIKDFLKNAVTKDENGRTHITLTLPDDNVIEKISDTIAKFLGKVF
jgi:hypothetical protein